MLDIFVILIYMRKYLLFCLLVIIWLGAVAQPDLTYRINVSVISADKSPFYRATVSLLRTDSSMAGIELSDAAGKAEFSSLTPGQYILRITNIGYLTAFKNIDLTTKTSAEEVITLQPDVALLRDVAVTSKKPAIQFLPDKTVVNVEASITNAGATIMDVLEKSPGVTIGRDGAIIMRGKPSVMVLIDGKQTQLSGAELQAYLQGISASQVDVIELIDNPGAKYDAAGNAGIINIKTKTSKQKGFNGSLSLSVGQGYYFKSNNSLNMNYRNGKFNWFVNYGTRLGRERTAIGALRKYFDQNGNDSLLLEQPNTNYSKINSHNIKTGIDFFASKNTTLGIVFTGNITDRRMRSVSTIDWMTPNYVIDSTIHTLGTRNTEFRRSGVNFYARHTINSTSEILADVDLINFDIHGDQYFQTQLSTPGSSIQATKGNIPSELKIFTAKVDYSKKFKDFAWEAGLKTASTNTDNLAQYYFHNGSDWQDDLNRSNHFLYDENIHSAYSSFDVQKGKWHWQAGARYELTSYQANQLGNTVVKD